MSISAVRSLPKKAAAAAAAATAAMTAFVWLALVRLAPYQLSNNRLLRNSCPEKGSRLSLET